MKAINLGDNTYDIFDDAMKVYSELPTQSYVVRCSKTRGFFLEKYNDMEIRESKIYGVHNEKIAKVMNMFSSSDRNLGVILSGAKGIGKSLFAKIHRITPLLPAQFLRCKMQFLERIYLLQ